MASQSVGEAGLTDSGPSNHHHHHHHLPYSVLHGTNNPPANFISQGVSAFDFGELEEAIVLQGVKFRNDEAKAPLFTVVSGRPATTLEMFPSWPMRFQQQIPRESSNSGEESTDSGSAVNTLPSKAEALLDPESPISKKASTFDHHQDFDQKQLVHQQQGQVNMVSGASRTGDPSLQNQLADKPVYGKRKVLTPEKQLDAKTLRRLAQNREAARKSRLRKKAYVQQLESSRIKLTQLEQDLQRERQQGLFLGGCGGASDNLSSGAAIFNMGYARWLEDDHKHMSELRTGLQAHLTDGDLRVIIDRYITHYDEIFHLRGVAAKSDVFHLITGMWSTPAERCFLWIGGFRPSELIKMLVPQLDPLTEQQLLGIYSLQHCSQQAEEALSHGLEQLQQSLVDTIAGGPIVEGMQQMAVALGKLANLEGFVRQTDNLRQQTIHQLRRILTVRQAARCFLVIAEYYGRLRALSSLWASRPQEALIGEDSSSQMVTTELQMVHPSQNHFPNF